MMIMPNVESEGIHQVVRYFHSPVLIIQRANSDLIAKKKREKIL